MKTGRPMMIKKLTKLMYKKSHNESTPILKMKTYVQNVRKHFL